MCVWTVLSGVGFVAVSVYVSINHDSHFITYRGIVVGSAFVVKGKALYVKNKTSISSKSSKTLRFHCIGRFQG